MSWQQTFATYAGPGAFCGIRFGDWLRVLAKNRFAVDPRYFLRAGLITGTSVPNSVLACYERWRFEERIRATKPEPPLFVLGAWRSGTTHLHNLLARDGRLAYPDFLEAFFPRTFLTTPGLYRGWLSLFLPAHRPQDNVRMAVSEPQEDEFALNCLVQLSLAVMWAFPRTGTDYERYLTFRRCTRAETEQWQAALQWFVQKLTFKHRRPLVLKSPGHTGRVKLILEVFPDARFVHIRRNPYDVFQSSLHMMRTAAPYWSLQRPDHRGLEERVLMQYAELYEAYFEEKDLIPHGRLYEMCYERLESDPLGELKQLYEALNLGEFSEAEAAIRPYLESIAGYQKNRYEPLQQKWKNEVACRWRRNFDEWGYAMER